MHMSASEGLVGVRSNRFKPVEAKNGFYPYQASASSYGF